MNKTKNFFINHLMSFKLRNRFKLINQNKLTNFFKK